MSPRYYSENIFRTMCIYSSAKWCLANLGNCLANNVECILNMVHQTFDYKFVGCINSTNFCAMYNIPDKIGPSETPSSSSWPTQTRCKGTYYQIYWRIVENMIWHSGQSDIASRIPTKFGESIVCLTTWVYKSIYNSRRKLKYSYNLIKNSLQAQC